MGFNSAFKRLIKMWVYIWKITAVWFFEGTYEAVGNGEMNVTGRECVQNERRGRIGRRRNVEIGSALIVFDL